MQHTSLNKCMSPSLLYTHGNTIINILILQIVCLLYKSHHYIICGLEGKHITTNISQTIHNHNSRSRDLSPGITTAFIWCLMPTKFTPHYSGHIITLWRYMWCIQKSIHPAWGCSILIHLQNSKHTYNNQPFVYHIGWWCGIWLRQK